jgi:DNA-binding CsgD family transcriptional regulator
MRAPPTALLFSQLLALIYQGVDEAQPWFAFVDCLADALDAHDASLLIYSKRQRQFYYHITTDRHFYWTEKSLQEVMQASYMVDIEAPAPMTERDWGRMPAFHDSRLYKEFLAPIDITHMIMHDVFSDEDVIFRIAATRTSKQKNFGAAERQLLQQLSPHLQRAADLRSRINAKDALANTAFELAGKLSIGCIVLNPLRQIIAINAPASFFIEQTEGLRIDNNVLQIGGAENCEALNQALEQALNAHAQNNTTQPALSLSWPHAADKFAELIVRPLFCSNIFNRAMQPAAIILLQDIATAASEAEEALLREKFGLSKSEAVLGVLLARGHTLNEAAEIRGVSLNTIKTHLRSMYEKLGLHRRSQLIALLAKNTNKLL